MAERSKVPAGWTLKETRRWMASEAAQYGEAFKDLPLTGANRQGGTIRALRNKHFLVQVFEPPANAPDVLCRLSINRALLNDSGDWLDGISWDQLQSIKNAVGYMDNDAVEVFPRVGNVVNVANIRHLWILRKPIPWAWGNERALDAGAFGVPEVAHG